MSNEVDYYDVQGMIRDERSAIRADINAAVSELRQAFLEEVESLRDDLASLARTVDSRTEHLA